MKIVVEMTAEEFQEFLAYRSDRDHFDKEEDKIWKKYELFAKKVLWTIEPDPKHPGKCKIIDQDHATELHEMANEVFC